MQHILINIKLNQLFIQCAEIVKAGEVSIWNEEGNKLLETPIINNNFVTLDLSFPKGNYQMELREDDKIWKKNFKL